jgi:C4-dicarboxylate-binding protein DctP
MRSRALSILVAFLYMAIAGVAAAQPKTLRLSLQVSASDPIGQNVTDFAREVEARTSGAVKIELHDKASLYEENEVVSAVSSGSVEMGAALLSQLAYDVPLAGIFLQPFMFNFNALVRAAAEPDSEIRSLIDEEVLYWTNSRVLWWQPYGSTVIFSKSTPAANPTAIANRHVAAPNDLMKDLAQFCGGEPRLMAASDLYSALEKKSADVAIADLFSVKEREFWRVTDTIAKTQHAPSLFIIMINDRVWETLAPEHQKILADVAREMQKRIWDKFAAVESETYAFAVQKGMTVKEITPEDAAAWRACSAPLLDSYMDRVGELGAKLFTAYGKLRTLPCCSQFPGAQ